MRPLLIVLLLVGSACDPTLTPHPRGSCPDHAIALCSTDADCQDGILCNGSERCDPMASTTDSCGCNVALPRCDAFQTCDETSGDCSGTTPPCGEGATDRDEDGHRSAACGGDDCDDNDPERHPGANELCSGPLRSGRVAADHDEDCNPCTVESGYLGDGDADHDGFTDTRCVNPWLTATAPAGCNPSDVILDGDTHVVHGNDCDDANGDVHPFQAEVCNHIDDNCSGEVDEIVGISIYTDADHDGQGDGTTKRPGCVGEASTSIFGDDCDDSNPAVTLGSIVCGGTATSFQQCKVGGSFVGGTCPAQQTCVSQPNGTGLCL